MFHNARCWTSETKFSHLGSFRFHAKRSFIFLRVVNVLATCVAYMSHTWLSSFFYCSELLLLHEMMILCNNYFLESYYVLSKEEIRSTPFSLFIYPATMGSISSSSLFLISSATPLKLLWWWCISKLLMFGFLNSTKPMLLSSSSSSFVNNDDVEGTMLAKAY